MSNVGYAHFLYGPATDEASQVKPRALRLCEKCCRRSVKRPRRNCASESGSGDVLMLLFTKKKMGVARNPNRNPQNWPEKTSPHLSVPICTKCSSPLAGIASSFQARTSWRVATHHHSSARGIHSSRGDWGRRLQSRPAQGWPLRNEPFVAVCSIEHGLHHRWFNDLWFPMAMLNYQRVLFIPRANNSVAMTTHGGLLAGEGSPLGRCVNYGQLLPPVENQYW